MILEITLFVIHFFLSMIVHEIGHKMTAEHYTDKPAKIELWWHGKIPSLRTTYAGTLTEQERRIFLVAGGLFSGTILMIPTALTILANSTYTISIFPIMLMQYCYGLYELAYRDELLLKTYMFFKNVVYIFTIFTGIVICIVLF